MSHACFDAVSLSQSHWCPIHSAGRQLCGNEEYFSGVTNSGRVWRKVPENNAWSVIKLWTFLLAFRFLHYCTLKANWEKNHMDAFFLLVIQWVNL